jgi:superfamily II DNA or RNA helicase/HKD family nuclease
VDSVGAGVYEHVVTAGWERRLSAVAADLVQRQGLDPADAAAVLARHVEMLVRRTLGAVGGEARSRLEQQVGLTNRIIGAIAGLAPGSVDTSDSIEPSHDLLAAIVERPPASNAIAFPVRPQTPFSSGALLVNGRGQPRIGREVATEMSSADNVDLLCAFVKWQGVRIVEGAVRDLVRRGGRLRLITTTYLGATDQRALDRLAELGADIKISYESSSTRLHAKAWLFLRGAGTTTAYVGSSNMSRAALVDGLEWNVRISQLEQPYLIDTFTGTFDEYWADSGFEDYVPSLHAERLREALALERGSPTVDADVEITNLDVRPYTFQEEILEELAAQREVHDRWRNLVVMATGTGKTVVAAVDYHRSRQAGRVDSLLFVAHQEQILRQSRSVFRHVLRDGTFGELLVGGNRPSSWRHLFASVQSLSRMSLTELDPSTFDMVIVDEFHHAEAPTYTRLLSHLQPRLLLGLTATPERADGHDVRRWFDGRTDAELRLWEALDRQLLAPFQYFGIHDDVDLSALRWKRGEGYLAAELSNVYTGHHARARIILQAVADKVDPGRMRALGFCVSIDHAEFMAKFFADAGVPAAAVTSSTDHAGRAAAMAGLMSGDLKILFTVDLFNEGVDLPAVDTILMLRPTQSATVFLQQLGRGLRRADNKACLVVLDFIGAQHAQFRFDLRYRALTGATRRGLARDVELGFPTLPAGCHIQLDSVAQHIVLANLRRSLTVRRQDLASELARLGDASLADFLAETGLELEDLYRNHAHGGWTGLRRAAGVDSTESGPYERQLSKAISRILHVDDRLRLKHLRQVAAGDQAIEGRLAAMLNFSLWNSHTAEFAEWLGRLHDDEARRNELRQVVDLLEARIHRITRPLHAASPLPLSLHARYRRDEACAAFGITNPSSIREGVRWVQEEQADLFFVTLTKTDRHYSPTTMYADRAITPTLFQWESQSTTQTSSPTGQRYVHHAQRGSTVHLFLRDTKEPDGDLGAPTYLYAGTMTYLQHTGDRPMRIQWRLSNALPADIYQSARVAAG